ncbi:MAG TPA: tRNA (5-methylaminomethyl-2-thiouridine)(34)-methyltransferase MnmD [Bacteroidales bacterium]|nr:tRNA (5-methylaminomethyl-2-thiouridine)(34)-methyltransferase MnmD [Bacteroidales bacterium]
MSQSVIKVKTSDNSYTLYSHKYNQHYHSIYGAVTESLHIYIGLGLKKFRDRNINILEIGYGTGLNAVLSFIENLRLNNSIYYHGIDIYPLSLKIIQDLGFVELLKNYDIPLELFCNKWDEEAKLSDNFILKKQNSDLLSFESDLKYDLIYFDAFSSDVQAELWEENVFQKLGKLTNLGGILVTYCSKGVVKQNLRNSGFIVNRFIGPPGKHHVVCATKI